MNAKTNSKHTPGPWTFRRGINSSDIGILGDNGCLAECFNEIRERGEGAMDEQLANARLISSAPELLEAALRVLEKRFVPGVSETSDLGHLAAAVAKAGAEWTPQSSRDSMQLANDALSQSHRSLI